MACPAPVTQTADRERAYTATTSDSGQRVLSLHTFQRNNNKYGQEGGGNVVEVLKGVVVVVGAARSRVVGGAQRSGGRTRGGAGEGRVCG